ncbi:MAG: helix-turn-helix domain-containing protein [Actinomycetia bacterium]|nr:helix-turn-helix domain-containing protein [Actinomycetes bacterium]
MNPPTRARRKMTARELGERFNRSPRTIRRIIAESREDWLERTQSRYQQIREMRATGMSMRAIAAELGCAVSTVHRALNTPESTD